MVKPIFKGCGTAIVTPFTENGIDFESFEKLIEFQISQGADSIIVCGTTGESSTMTENEKKSVIKFATSIVNKRIPVIAGTGGNCTQSVVSMSRYAEEAGVDGLLIVTPYYNKTTQEGLISHYSTVAVRTSLPIILYNVPSRTGLNILPKTCKKLSEIENIVAIKEASGNISQIAEISMLCGNSLAIYSGNDDLILPVLSLGGLGAISVISNIIPNDVHKMIEYYFTGNINNSLKIQLAIFPLVKALFSEVNPIPIKFALNKLGFKVGSPRLPLIEMSQKGQELLCNELKKYGLIN